MGARAGRGQGGGEGRAGGLAEWARGQGGQWLWLDVRAGNELAQQMYVRHGYRRVGERKSYYPAANGKREDAVVMSLKL